MGGGPYAEPLARIVSRMPDPSHAPWRPRALTRTRRDDGALYRREETVEREILSLCRLPDRQRRDELTRDHHRVADRRWREETLVYALREYARCGDDEAAWQIAEILTERIGGHVARQIARWRLSPEDADDCVRDLYAVLFDALFDRSSSAEFWEVRFWVCVDRRLWNLVEKRQATTDAVADEFGETSEGDALESRLLRIADDSAGPEERAQRNAALALLADHERMAIYLKYVEGLVEESDDPERMTIARMLGVSGRSVRNYLRRAEAKLQEWVRTQ